MAVAEVVPLQNERVSLTSLIQEKREMGATTVDEITATLLAEGLRLFEILDDDSRRQMLRQAVLRTITQERSRNVWQRNSRSDSSTRIGQAGAAYWSSQWNEVGGKTTSELDANDLKILIRLYRERAARYINQVKWLERVDELRRQHHASTLGDLRKKGIELPMLEQVAE